VATDIPERSDSDRTRIYFDANDMKSEINNDLTDRERTVLALYRAPSNSESRRLIRLSIQYAIATGCFMVLAIVEHQPLYALFVYVVLLVWLVLRVVGASTMSRVMPKIIDKYESTITTLKLNFAEVEPLLVAGYERLKANEAVMSHHAKMNLIDAIRRLVDFYATTGQPEKADEWRMKLEKAQPREPPV
jgi:hypothetical protein